jgi:glycosyltransferase involved in cell wall biosynthesis
MMTKEIVSVVIPSYNHQAYVLKAVESVLEQDWPSIDLIVIDDGSTDASPQILTDYHKRRGGFRLLINRNNGLIKTLNEGLRMAHGEYLCFLASDDYFLPNSISCRASYLANHPDCVAVFCDAQVLRGDVLTDQRLMSNEAKRLFELSDPIPDFIQGVHLPIHTLMTRTATFRKIGGYDERYQRCEDLDPQLLLYLEGPIKFIDVPVSCYRQHLTNTSKVNPNMARVDKVLMYRKYLDEVDKLVPYRRSIQHQLKRQYLLLGRYLGKNKTSSTLEKEIFRGAWKYAWRDVRLFWHLIRFFLTKQ